jgi:predicted RNA-binding protein
VIKAMADYQFGIGAGSELVTWNKGERIKITGTFPRYTLSLDCEVLAIAGTKAFGVGRAKMSGWEMVQSRKGVAVQVREVELRGEA